jgi:hypothetical protein
MPSKIVRKTAEQLKTAVWPTREAALADLRVSKLAARGEDYELGEYRPGKWQLLPLDGGEVIREDRVIENLRRKHASKGRAEPEVIAHAKAPPKKGLARANGKKPKPAKPERKQAAQPSTPAKPPEKPAQPASLFPPDEPEAGKTDASAEPAAKSADPYRPLPADDGPYEFHIRAAEGAFANNNALFAAISFSKRMKCKVNVFNGNGKLVREIDVAAIQAMARGSRGRPSKSGTGKGFGKSAEAAKLFMRPQGATFAEVVQITEWGISERFVRRLARANKCEPEMLGDKHWRLNKPSA